MKGLWGNLKPSAKMRGLDSLSQFKFPLPFPFLPLKTFVLIYEDGTFHFLLMPDPKDETQRTGLAPALPLSSLVTFESHCTSL